MTNTLSPTPSDIPPPFLVRDPVSSKAVKVAAVLHFRHRSIGSLWPLIVKLKLLHSGASLSELTVQPGIWDRRGTRQGIESDWTSFRCVRQRCVSPPEPYPSGVQVVSRYPHPKEELRPSTFTDTGPTGGVCHILPRTSAPSPSANQRDSPRSVACPTIDRRPATVSLVGLSPAPPSSG
jgi:hypothetical protein